MTGLPAYRATIAPSWIDYNGHLRDAYYGLIASYAVDDVMDHLGIDADYRQRTQCTLYTLELHLHYLHEVKGSDELDVATSIFDFDSKRIHLGCRFTCPRQESAVATAELMLLHVRQAAKPASTAMPESVIAVLQAGKLTTAAREAWGPQSRLIEIKRR